MHSASARFACARFKSCGRGLWNPAGHPLTCKAVPAPQHAREAEARRTRGMHEAEQGVGIAEGFEEQECEREHLGRRGAGASHQKCASATKGAGRSFLGELCKGILHMHTMYKQGHCTSR